MDRRERDLKDLLVKWGGIDCSPSFNEKVRQRIMTAPVPRPSWLAKCYEVLQERFMLVAGEAALAGAVAGIVLATMFVQPTRPAELNAFSFMAPATLSGSFSRITVEAEK